MAPTWWTQLARGRLRPVGTSFHIAFASALAGITNGRVFRRAEDQNDVVILQDVANVAKARTWLASDEMKAAMEKGGVVGTPNIRFAAAA